MKKKYKMWLLMPLCRMVIKPKLMSLSNEELLKTIENNQTTVMFRYKEHTIDKLIRYSNGELDRIEVAIEKYPPLYANSLTSDLNRAHIAWASFLESFDNLVQSINLVCPSFVQS
jgi:hypothetical protein